MYESCLISTSTAPRHLKIGKERAYTMIYHKMDLFFSRSNHVRIMWLEMVTKRYDDFCHKISRSLLPLKTDLVDIVFQHRLKLGSLYFFNKKSL